MKYFIKLTIICCSLLYVNSFIAQTNQEYNPYESIGQKAEVLTLSKGKYIEFFDLDSIEIIGDAILNTNTMKVIGFVERDTSYSEATLEPEIVSRWLSPDPVIQPQQSPYSFVNNNPIIYIDQNGEDNVIYLVALGSSKSNFSKEDVQSIAAKANKIYESMGLNTRVVVYESNDPFDPAHIDPTDSYAVLGSVSDVTTTIESYGGDATDTWGGGGPTHPENSSNPSIGQKNTGIALDSDAMQSFSFDTGAESKENATAFLIVHGSGHNAGVAHTYHPIKFQGMKLNLQNTAIMTNGQGIYNMTNLGYGDEKFSKLIDFTNCCENTLFKPIIEARFGNNKAQDNYKVNAGEAGSGVLKNTVDE